MQFFGRFVGRNIMVSPLDWGLGHAARMVPVVRMLSQKNRVTVVCGPNAKEFLDAELLNIEIITINDRLIRYPAHRITIFTMLSWLPVLAVNAIREHFFVKRIIQKQGIDTIISDNRYGLIFRRLECYFVTHQVYPKLPNGFGAIEKLLGALHRLYLQRFTKCLIPDFETGFSLSGNLAGNRVGDNPKFVKVGILSRFCNYPQNKEKVYDILILISGQENQRTVFERSLLDKIKDSSKRILLVRGVSENTLPLKDFNNVVFKNMLTSDALADAITSSKLVVCRSGYSTILDLVALNAPAVLIPTPGQTEQEYLAEWLDGKLGFFTKFAPA